ncbi:MAG: TIGR02391 family protein [Candidatus Devosia phytovorans]|uniref:TIGR02391 family protein n=1 Tax=Candidatus Devosia phytovorans TaxID=3121372 RepID=A0AAJ6B0S5_9HYPH|nr:TIGR02391 family protein [Devosia sp.]WEK03803.1 MAG: TIGR02391 family protein [Devosia sp.]
MHDFLEGVRRFREFLLEVGASQSTLALPAPRMLALAAPEEEVDPQRLYTVLIVEPELVEVSRDLFVSGHFSLAIQEAFKALEKFLQVRVDNFASGTTRMDQVFSPKSPQLAWSNRRNQSEMDEQLGYHRMFAGAVQGIRNPCAHEFNWVDEPETALDLLLFVQHLLRKARMAAPQRPRNGREAGAITNIGQDTSNA